MPPLKTGIERQSATAQALQAENAELRLRLQEAEETIDAIRTGMVDALVVEEPAGARIYTLEGADRPYRLFVEEMQQGAAMLHADGDIVWCNRQLADLLRIRPEKLLGARLHEFVAPNHRSIYDNLLWQGQTRSGRAEVELRRSDGGLVPAFLTFSALPKDCDAVIGVLVTDLTTQRHHEELTTAHAALRESEHRFRKMIDSLPVAIYTTDAEGHLTHFNPAAVKFSGHTPELGTDQWCVSFKLYHPDGTPMPHDECPMAVALKEGRIIRDAEAIAELPDGTRRWFTPYPTPLRDRAGKIVGGINLLLDITERKQAEEQVRRNHDTFFNLIENAPFGVYLVDAQFRLRQVSAGSKKVFATVRPLLGRDFAEVLRVIWAEPFASEVIGRFRHTLETGEPYIAPNATEKRHDIAEVQSYDWRIERVPIPDGQFGVVCYFYDLTERKQAEEARARLAAIVDSSDDAVISITLQGIITSWNAGAEKLFGFRAEEIIGQSITVIIPTDHQGEEKEILGRVGREDRLEHFETVRVAKDGRRIDVSLSVSPIRDGTGRVIGASKIARDITERKRAERALQAAQAELQRHAQELEMRVAERTADLQATNDQLEAFVYSIAHDLRAPLRAMTGFSQLLVDDYASGLNETARNLLQRIHASSAFMDKLLLDLLAYGRAAQTDVELESVEVRKAWEAARFQTRNQAEQAQACIEVTGTLPAVRAHESTLGQCLANMLSNAMKFVAPGVRPHIRFHAEEIIKSPTAARGEARVRLWLEDNGIGIAPEDQKRAFRVFERLNGARYTGTGIGLSIVRKGIERMGGCVGLESEPSKGSRFWIELPKAE